METNANTTDLARIRHAVRMNLRVSWPKADVNRMIAEAGDDVVALNHLLGKKPRHLPKTLRQCAEEAYQRYGAVTEFKNFRGDPMPAFADLPDKIKEAWEAAVNLPEGDVTLG